MHFELSQAVSELCPAIERNLREPCWTSSFVSHGGIGILVSPEGVAISLT